MVGVAIVVFDAVSGATAGWIAGAYAAVAMTVSRQQKVTLVAVKPEPVPK